MKWAKTLLLLLVSSTCSASFSGYTYQQLITINSSKVPSTQPNFPVLISTTDAKLATPANGGHLANSSGFDLVFSTNSDCSFLLKWDTETYNASTGQIRAWVKVPSVTAVSSATLYMCYGNSAITTYRGVSSTTWDTNFKRVYHVTDGTTLNLRDASGNINATNSAATAVTGMIDGGVGTTGGSNITSSNSGLPVGTTARTFEAWVNSPSFNAFSGIFQYGDSSPGALSIFGLTANTVCLLGFSADTCSVGTIPTSTWTHLVGTFDGTNGRIYVNGALFSGPTALAWNTSNVDPLTMGTWPNGGASTWGYNGSLDELRLSNIARSDDWIATTYNTESSPATFYTLGAETTTPPVNPISKGLQVMGGCVVIRGGKMQVL